MQKITKLVVEIEVAGVLVERQFHEAFGSFSELRRCVQARCEKEFPGAKLTFSRG